jgi:hypothetical protein
VAQVSPGEHDALVQQLERLILSKHIQRASCDSVFSITLMGIIVYWFPIMPEKKKPKRRSGCSG